MTHTSYERATATVFFAGMRACAKRMLIAPFLADQSIGRKMATSKQKAFCILQFTKTESAITVQRVFRIKFGYQPLNDNNIIRWYQFETTGYLYKWKSTGLPRL
ncbi:DUF4817 domain-containing protein [Trichonephila clavipes]|nr:DUF4817 domain-containing protein [Trichonephila clavipes]